MADRTVAVRLLARVDQYKRDMAGAADATKKFGTDAAVHTRSLSDSLSTVSTQSTVVGAALLGVATASVVAAASFDKQMSGVAAVAGATAEEMDKMRKAALQAGADTAYTASEAAQAEGELAKAGVKTSDILGGALNGSLSLAAAGQLSVADSATIAAQAMNVFHLAGKDVGHIADVLAAGANKSAADVGQLGDALRQGGLVASQTGLTLEDTVGVLSAFADRALIGSDAGTSLKTMLQRLTPQSEQAQKAMDALGLSAFDSSGNFVGITQYAGRLQTALHDLTPEQRATTMSILFGSDAVRAATILYDLGAKGVDGYVKAVNDSGAANRMAATQLDNLAGDWEQLSGSIETAFIKSGSSANGILRDTVQLGTQVVNIIGGMPTPVLAAGLAVSALGGAFLVLAPRIVAAKAALESMPASAQKAASGIGRVSAAFAAMVAASAVASALSDTLVAGGKSADEMAAALSRVAKGGAEDFGYQITGIIGQTEDFNGALASVVDNHWWDKIGAGLSGIFGQEQSTTLGAARHAVENVDSALAALVKSGNPQEARVAFERLRGEWVAAGGAGEDFDRVMMGYNNALAAGTKATDGATQSVTEMATATVDAATQLKALKDEWDATTGALLGVSDATIAAEASLDAVTKTIKENGNQWSITTEKGRANQSAINDAINTFESLRTKMVETGQATEQQANAKMVAYLTQLRSELPKSAKTARGELDLLIAKYSQIPANKNTTVTADTSQATAAAQAVKDAWKTTVSYIASHPAKYRGLMGAASGGYIQHFAGGGSVRGGGSSTSDSVPAMLSNGEFVVNAAATSQNLALLHAINSGARLAPSGGGGGAVQYVVNVQMPRGFVVGSDVEIGREIARVLQRTQGSNIKLGIKS